MSVQFLADGGEHRLAVLPSRLQWVSLPLLLTPASKMLSCTCPACLFSMAEEFKCHALINYLHGFWLRAGWCQAQNTGRQSWLAESALVLAIIMMESSWKCEDDICKPRENVLSSVICPLCLALGESIWSTRSSLGLPGKRYQQSGMSQEEGHVWGWSTWHVMWVWRFGALCYLLLFKEPLQTGCQEIHSKRWRLKNSS